MKPYFELNNPKLQSPDSLPTIPGYLYYALGPNYCEAFKVSADGSHPDTLIGWLPCQEYTSSDVPVINPLWEYYYPEELKQQSLGYKIGDIVYSMFSGKLEKIESFLIWEPYGYEVELVEEGTFWFAGIRPATPEDGEYVEEDT